MASKILLHESDEGYLFFDAEKVWFYFLDKNPYRVDNVDPIFMFRPGNFNLTSEETNAIKQWLMENLKDGVLQSRQTDF